MKKIAVFTILYLLLLPVCSVAGAQETILEVAGYGLTKNEAIRNGLIEALKQHEGVAIASQKSFAKSLEQRSFSKDGDSTREVAVAALSEGVVREITQGLINEYRILESQEITSNEWEVLLAVKMLRYETPGISPHNRRKIAVLPFYVTKNSIRTSGSTSPAEVSRQFSQKLVTELTQARKFSVFDREYTDAFLKEKKFLLSGETSLDEQIKVGEALGVDYLLVGTISELTEIETPYAIQITGARGVDYSASFLADYRIVVMATRQVKWADSVSVSLSRDGAASSTDLIIPLLAQGAKDVVQSALANIYPLKIVKVLSGGEVILNQGGVTVEEGGLFDVYAAGEKVVDPYTGESLGASESWVGQIELTRVNAKMSYGKVVKGDPSLVVVESICRRRTAEMPSTSGGRRMKTDVTNAVGGGVVLPFD